MPWLPAGGSGSLAHLVLPAVSLGLFGAGVIARQTRSAMPEALGEEFVRTARSKGLSERGVVYRHALKLALIPVVTVNIHFHSLVLEGVYTRPTPTARPVFHRIRPPTDADIATLLTRLHRRVRRLLARRGRLSEVAVATDPFAAQEPLFASTVAASLQGRVALGPRAGQPLGRLRSAASAAAAGPRCAGSKASAFMPTSPCPPLAGTGSSTCALPGCRFTQATSPILGCGGDVNVSLHWLLASSHYSSAVLRQRFLCACVSAAPAAGARAAHGELRRPAALSVPPPVERWVDSPCGLTLRSSWSGSRCWCRGRGRTGSCTTGCSPRMPRGD